MSEQRGSLLVHLTADILTGVDRRKCFHAVVNQGIHRNLDRGRRARMTYDSVCGKRVRLAGCATVDEDGKTGGMTLPWPPRLKVLEGSESRCQSCFVATGKPRPDSLWDDTRNAPPTPQEDER